MAARKQLLHSERTRQRIQTSMLVNRLTDFVKGEVELSAAQVTAALGLIKKTVPDLQSIEHSGEVVNRVYDFTGIPTDALSSVERVLELARPIADGEGGTGSQEAGSIH